MPVKIVKTDINDINCDIAIIVKHQERSNDRADRGSRKFSLKVKIPNGGKAGHAGLSNIYMDAFERAYDLGCRTISAEIPSAVSEDRTKRKTLSVVLKAAKRFLRSKDGNTEIYLCTGEGRYSETERNEELERFLKDNYEEAPMSYGLAAGPARLEKRAVKGVERTAARGELFTFARADTAECAPMQEADANLDDLDEWLKKHDDSFRDTLLSLIDRKNMTDAECYKRANVSRKTFSKIKNEPSYRPSKQTALAFAIALELTLDETQSFLSTAGFSLSRSSKADLIVEYFIRKRCYDIEEINEALYNYDQPCLGY